LRSNSGTSSKGFTLIEVVVSITIMAMLSVAVLSALRTSLLIWDKGTSRIENIRRSRTAREVLDEQIRGALPMTYAVNQNDQLMFTLAFEGDRHHIRFVSRSSFKDGPDGIPRWVDLS
jgi:prepilin-type N-terminal cleavage/methylation domain-containing protein